MPQDETKCVLISHCRWGRKMGTAGMVWAHFPYQGLFTEPSVSLHTDVHYSERDTSNFSPLKNISLDNMIRPGVGWEEGDLQLGMVFLSYVKNTK